MGRTRQRGRKEESTSPRTIGMVTDAVVGTHFVLVMGVPSWPENSSRRVFQLDDRELPPSFMKPDDKYGPTAPVDVRACSGGGPNREEDESLWDPQTTKSIVVTKLSLEFGWSVPCAV